MGVGEIDPMDLTLTEEIVMLSLEEERGTHVPMVPNALGLALAGALLCDFERLGAVCIEDETVCRTLESRPVPAFLAPFLEDVQGRESIRHWIARFFEQRKNLEKAGLENLVAKGVLDHRERRFLKVFHFDRYPASHHEERQEARERLHRVLADGNGDVFDTSLFAILCACGLLRDVLGGVDIAPEVADAAVRSHPVARVVKAETEAAVEEILRVQGNPASPFSI